MLQAVENISQIDWTKIWSQVFRTRQIRFWKSHCLSPIDFSEQQNLDFRILYGSPRKIFILAPVTLCKRLPIYNNFYKKFAENPDKYPAFTFCFSGDPLITFSNKIIWIDGDPQMRTVFLWFSGWAEEVPAVFVFTHKADDLLWCQIVSVQHFRRFLKLKETAASCRKRSQNE